MDRADAHIHLFAAGYPGRYGRSPAGGDELATYQDLRRAHRIDRALVVGYEGAAPFAGNNRYLAALAASHDWIAPVAYVAADSPPDEGTLDRWWAEGFVGLSVYVPDTGTAEQVAGWLRQRARQLDAAGAVLSLNATPAATALLGPTLAELSGCTVLFSHLGLPGPQPTVVDPGTAAAILAPLLALADVDHVGVKLSGLYAVSDPPHDYPHHSAAPFVALLLDRFGPRRLYWGSDFAPSLDAVSFVQTLQPVGLDGLSDTERADVFGANLRRALARVTTTGPTRPVRGA